MGHQLLRIKVLAFIVISTALYAQTPVEKIDLLIGKIKEPRHGLSKSEIATSFDPFVYIKEDKKIVIKKPQPKPKKRFVLTAVINNRVKLNGKWYGTGDIVEGYKIVEVQPNTVKLSHNGTITTVTMPKSGNKHIKLIQKKD